MIWFSPHVSLSLCSDHCKMWSRSLGSFNRNYHEGFEYFGRCLSFLNSTALQSCQMQSWNCTGVQLTLKVEFKDSCSLGHRDWVNDGRGKRAMWPFPQPQLSHICHTFFFSLMLFKSLLSDLVYGVAAALIPAQDSLVSCLCDTWLSNVVLWEIWGPWKHMDFLWMCVIRHSLNPHKVKAGRWYLTFTLCSPLSPMNLMTSKVMESSVYFLLMSRLGVEIFPFCNSVTISQHCCIITNNIWLHHKINAGFWKFF